MSPRSCRFGQSGRRRAVLAAATVALLATGWQASPLRAQETTEQGFGSELSVGWVLVPVVVRTHSGAGSRLGAKDFELYVDGKRTPFEDFEARADAPLSLVFMQDLSGSMAISGKLEGSQQVVRTILDASKMGDEFAIATFGGGLNEVEVPFTNDLEPLREAVGTWKPYGKTALHDAVAWIPEISQQGQNAKRAAILVTDGVDNQSTLDPHQAREIVRQAQVPVYVIGMRTGDPYALGAGGEKQHRYADVLNLLAYFTGGQYHSISGPEELTEAIASILADLRSQYILSFSTRAGGPEAYHDLRVEVKASAVRTFFRRGYRGRLPSSLAAQRVGSP